jgi:hypothetical protein
MSTREYGVICGTNGEGLVLRKGVGKQTLALDLMPEGDRVELLGRDGDWYRVRWCEKGKPLIHALEGYGFAKYIRYAGAEPPDLPKLEPRPVPKQRRAVWPWLVGAAIVAIILAAVSMRSARSAPLPEATPAQRALCEPDAEKFCRQFFPRKLRVLRCLKENRANISPGCDALLRRYGQ